MGRSVTPNTVNQIQPVTSAVGFLSGDLVYENTSGISRIPDNAVATATFPVNANVPDYRYTSESAGNLKYVENVGGGQFAPSSARLTNGNIVVAYGIRNTATSTNNDVYFKIVDSNDTVVVAQTAVATVAGGVYMNCGSAGALALPNGGFVVVFHGFDGTTRRISYRVYNASGVAQTALITDTSVSTGTSSYQIAFAARSDSSFVVAFVSSAGNPTYRVYSATGTTVYSGTFAAAIGAFNGSRQLAVVVRSDNSYVLVSCEGNTLDVRYNIFSSTNTSLAASNFSASPDAAMQIDAVLLASDVVGIGVYTNGGKILYRSLTGTTLSASTTIITGFNSINLSGFAMSSFSSGSRFIVTYSFFSNSTTGQAYNNSYKMSYAVFDSSGAVVTATQTLKGITVYTSNQVPAFVEVGSTLRIYMSPISTYNAQSPAYSPKGIYYAVINTATSGTIPQQSFALTSGTTPAQPVSGYDRASSTPSTAKFFASSTSSIVASISQSTSAASTQVFGKTFLDNFGVSSIASCYLGSGRYAVAYMGNSTTNVRIVILNSSGTILNTITPGAGQNGATGSIRICCLGNGRIVVAYRSDATSISYRVYSPSYDLLLSGIITATVATTEGTFSLSPLGSSSLTNNYFVIAYITSANTPQYSVYADNNTTPVATAQVDGSAWNSADVVGLRSGDFYVGGYSTGFGSYRMAYFANNLAGNAWTAGFVGNTPNSSSSGIPLNSICMATQDDIAVFAYGDGGSNTYMLQMASGSNANFVTRSGSSVNPITGGASQFAISSTGAGDMFYTCSTAVSGGAGGATFPMPYGYSNFISTSISGSTFFPVPNTSVNLVSLSPSFNNSAIYATVDAATAFPVAAVVYPIVGSAATNLTAGVSTSSAIPLTPTRFVLKGVGVTTCSAGGSGLIQTSGVAQLNTQYSSLPSQPFDSTNQIINGVRGIVSGRTVTIEG
jgi:hypothetical protein